MTVLSLTKPFETTESFLIVENNLKVGTHAFRLVVVDDDGIASDPFDAVVVIRDATLVVPGDIFVTPTRLIDPTGPIVSPTLRQTAPTTPTIRPRGGKPL